jgi:peroxiredoxin
MKDLFSGKRVVLFGVPAPFTGTCTLQHYPGYKKSAKALKEAGVDSIVCYAVSDPYAHHGWSLTLDNNEEDILFLADHEGKWAKAFGVDTRYDDASLGLRSIRFSMLVDNGEVKAFNVVDDASKDAEVILQEVKSHTGK